MTEKLAMADLRSLLEKLDAGVSEIRSAVKASDADLAFLVRGLMSVELGLEAPVFLVPFASATQEERTALHAYLHEERIRVGRARGAALAAHAASTALRAHLAALSGILDEKIAQPVIQGPPIDPGTLS